MRLRFAALLLAALVPNLASAQDFGVMESAETINPGNFKLRVNPMLFLGKHGAEDDFGIAAVAGYGFTRQFDLEGGVSIAEGVRMFGATAEFNLQRDPALSVSIIPGFHVRRGDRTVHTTGLDLVFLASHRLTPRLDFYGALDLAFENVDDRSDDDADYKTAHLVPGLEYKLHQDLEVLAEFGIALNDAARHYLSGGLVMYFR